jgi:hypothetical protein
MTRTPRNLRPRISKYPQDRTAEQGLIPLPSVPFDLYRSMILSYLKALSLLLTKKMLAYLQEI